MKHYEIMIAPFNTYSWLPDYKQAEYLSQDAESLKYLYKIALSQVKDRALFENMCMVCKVNDKVCNSFLFIN